MLLRFVIEEDAKFQTEVSASEDGKHFCVQAHGVQLTSLPSAFMIYFTLPPSPSASGERLPSFQNECQGQPLFEVT